jgi:4-hydroxy-4-methyl-2-oxoglutarate aldolase
MALMNKNTPQKIFRDLAKLDSYAVADAIDSLRVRLSNEGSSGPGITCRTPSLAPMAGVAVTVRVRASDPPMKPAFYLEHPDWWESLEEAGYPRVLVIEDMDARPGRGSLVGPVHACIIRALGFVGVVTTGAIRGTQRFVDVGLHAFSGNLSPSHGYSHVVEMGKPVTVAGVAVRTGDLVHGDRDGVVCLPADLSERIPDAVARAMVRERAICEFCASAKFSREKLRGVIGDDPSRW